MKTRCALCGASFDSVPALLRAAIVINNPMMENESGASRIRICDPCVQELLARMEKTLQLAA